MRIKRRYYFFLTLHHFLFGHVTIQKCEYHDHALFFVMTKPF